MDVTQLFILQFIAHLLADYTFQTGRRACDKDTLEFKSNFLKWHVLVIFGFSWVLSFQWLFVFGSLAIALSHWLLDGFKHHIRNRRETGNFTFFIDQAVHLLILSLVVILYTRLFTVKPVVNISLSIKYLLIIAAYLICTKPANILIKEILVAFEIKFADQGESAESIPNAGKLIGVIERWLVLTFILCNQFESIGFLIAAKSILRFKEADTVKTEYVLIGTMLSFSISIAMGNMILHT